MLGIGGALVQLNDRRLPLTLIPILDGARQVLQGLQCVVAVGRLLHFPARCVGPVDDLLAVALALGVTELLEEAQALLRHAERLLVALRLELQSSQGPQDPRFALLLAQLPVESQDIIQRLRCAAGIASGDLNLRQHLCHIHLGLLVPRPLDHRQLVASGHHGVETSLHGHAGLHDNLQRRHLLRRLSRTAEGDQSILRQRQSLGGLALVEHALLIAHHLRFRRIVADEEIGRCRSLGEHRLGVRHDGLGRHERGIRHVWPHARTEGGRGRSKIL
mmetsp:Transcript_76862/g.106767  ORF Transcript_76862/g.106767 Transcript_76862/m.106767 type:complete len:275 (-) Transcript_76862:14-838(-)